MSKPKDEKFGPVGQCIYCGTTDGSLSDEHVVPANFGGRLILLKSSCDECAEQVNRTIEQPLMQRSFGKIRYQRDIGTRNLKKRPKELPIKTTKGNSPPYHGSNPETLDASKLETEYRSIDDHPMFFALPVFFPPGISRYDEEFVAYSDDHAYRVMLVSKGAKSGASIISTYSEVELSNLMFLRFLAKIAHGFGVTMFGLDGFDPCLTDIITGNDLSTTAHYIGASPLPLPDTGMPISIGDGVATRRGEKWVFVNIRLFPDLEGTPTYQAFVGGLIKEGCGYQQHTGNQATRRGRRAKGATDKG